MLNRRTFLAASSLAIGAGLPCVAKAAAQSIECCEHRTLTLADGRRLSYATYGDPLGWPVLYFHGIPTSRIEARFFAAEAFHAGCRLIAIDRPGYGHSDFKACRQIVNWLDDVQQFIQSSQLPPDLDLAEYSVASFSSGAAYALLFALMAPLEQLKSVAIVDGIAPLEKISGCGGTAEVGFKLARKNPRLVRAAFKVNTRQMKRRPNAVLRRTSHFFSKCDRSVFFEPENARNVIDCYLECTRCGPLGVQYDMALLSCPWGFCIEQISLPVRLYYGACDITTPPDSMGAYLHRAIPNSQLTIVPGQGHLSMWNRIGGTMFSGMLADRR